MKKRIISVLLVLVLVFSVFPISSLAAAPDYDPYTALGDSITTGFTFDGGYVPSYVALAAGELGVSFNNDSILGIKSSDLLKLLALPSTLTTHELAYYDASTNSLHDQIVGDLTSSNLVTIAVGSNDLTMTVLDMLYQVIHPINYPDEPVTDADLKVMTPADHVAALEEVGVTLYRLYEFFDDMNYNMSAKVAPPVVPDNIKDILNALSDFNPACRLQTAVDDFKLNWDGIINKIKEIRPEASIAAIGYYNPYPMLDRTITFGDCEINLGFQDYINQMNEYISGAYGECEVASGYIYVDVSDAGLPGSALTLCSDGDPHPDADGHEEIAKRLLAALGIVTPAEPGSFAPSFIDVKSSAGGSISTSGFPMVTGGNERTLAYVQGVTAVFTFIPDNGYEVDAVIVDGEPVDTAGTYTFKNIMGSHSISVTFVKEAEVNSAA